MESSSGPPRVVVVAVVGPIAVVSTAAKAVIERTGGAGSGFPAPRLALGEAVPGGGGVVTAAGDAVAERGGELCEMPGESRKPSQSTLGAARVANLVRSGS